MEGQDIQVPMISDIDANSEEAKPYVAVAAELIRAARDGRLVSIMFGRDDGSKELVFASAMIDDETGQKGYLPIAVSLVNSLEEAMSELIPPLALSANG